MSEIAPMNIREAIEVIKIISPYAPEFTKTEKPIKIMRAIMEGILKDMPAQSLRLLSLMEHKSIDDLAVELNFARGSELIVRVSEGFGRNNLQALVDAAYYLRMSEARWELDNGDE